MAVRLQLSFLQGWIPRLLYILLILTGSPARTPLSSTFLFQFLCLQPPITCLFAWLFQILLLNVGSSSAFPLCCFIFPWTVGNWSELSSCKCHCKFESSASVHSRTTLQVFHFLCPNLDLNRSIGKKSDASMTGSQAPTLFQTNFSSPARYLPYLPLLRHFCFFSVLLITCYLIISLDSGQILLNAPDFWDVACNLRIQNLHEIYWLFELQMHLMTHPNNSWAG